MRLQKLQEELTVCKVTTLSDIDEGADLLFIGKTDEEISVVCPTARAPRRAVAREDGWRAFRVCGVLDFSLVGVLAKITAVLAENGIGIFAVSTYNTDYILVKAAQFEKALAALAGKGCEIV